jgi:hypothetical protein
VAIHDSENLLAQLFEFHRESIAGFGQPPSRPEFIHRRSILAKIALQGLGFNDSGGRVLGKME